MAQHDALERWETRLESTPSAVQTIGNCTARFFDSPLSFRSGSDDCTADMLAPLIARTLPGYGQSLAPARCLANASRPVVFTRGTDFVGFLAFDLAQVHGVTVGYLTLAAVEPELQGTRLLSSATEYLLSQCSVSVVAATTNVPDLYAMLERLSVSRCGAESPFILPHLDSQSPAQACEFGRAVLASVLHKPLESVLLDRFMVRRRYRDRDLQSVPMHQYLLSRFSSAQVAGRHRVAAVARGFSDYLHLESGDAVLVLAALDGTLASVLQGKLQEEDSHDEKD